MRTFLVLASLALAAAESSAQQAGPLTKPPPNGFVPDSATAVRIAVAVWIPIFGEQRVMSEQPFVATLEKDVWTVTGSLPHGGHIRGGTAIARISKRDGMILLVAHTQ